MIELVRIAVAGDQALDVTFRTDPADPGRRRRSSTGTTVLTRPLADPSYFARAFVDAGALAWPNGLESSAHSLHATLAAAGKLAREAA